MNSFTANIMFYSDSCPTCQNLIMLLKNEGLLPKFKMLSYERDKKYYPDTIKTVPTLIIAGVPKPMVGPETFTWLNSIKFLRNQQQIDNNKKIAHMNMVRNMQQNQIGPNPVITSEMTGFSDAYAYTDGEINNAQPKTFFGYGEEDKNAIFTAEEMVKVSKNDQNKKLIDIENDRKTQEIKFKEIMKMGQFNEVMKHEQNRMKDYKN
jgi:ribosomal protein L25 (general stress protein Ctc)